MSTQVTTYANASKPVERAIRQAARTSGVDFDYLMRTAARESSFNPKAEAATSSATGLFQFIDQTWLRMVKEEGASHGLKRYARAIDENVNGRFSVDSPSMKKKILNLRKDPKIAAQMAAAFTESNQRRLQATLGRQPTDGELYIAHFMGASGASRFLSATQKSPDAVAAKLVPRQAAANKPIFYTGKGHARSLEQVYARLVRYHDGNNALITGTTTQTTKVAAAKAQPIPPEVQPAAAAERVSQAPATPLPTEPIPIADQAPPARPSRFGGWVARADNSVFGSFYQSAQPQPVAAPAGSRFQPVQSLTESGALASRFSPSRVNSGRLEADAALNAANGADAQRLQQYGDQPHANRSRFATYVAPRDISKPI